MPDWQAVLFDLDDTLYPERDYCLSGLKAAAGLGAGVLKITADEGFTELKALFDQGVRRTTFDAWLQRHGARSQGLVESLVHTYRTHQPTLHLFPGVTKLLLSLRRRYRLGLVSDGLAEVQRRKLDALDVARYFDAVVLSDDLGREAWKPSPLGLNAALRLLGGIPPSAALYVADNPLKDFLAARRAGMPSIQILHPGGLYGSLPAAAPEYRPTAVISSLEDLPRCMEELRYPATVS